MKKITKLFALLLIIPLMSVCFVGCKSKNNTSNDTTTQQEEWIIVKSVTVYYPNGTSTTSSTYDTNYSVEYTKTDLTKEEYDALDMFVKEPEQYITPSQASLQEFKVYLESEKGMFYKWYNRSYYNYACYKYQITGYTVSFVEVQMLSSNCIKIKKDNVITQYTSDYIKINCFNEKELQIWKINN